MIGRETIALRGSRAGALEKTHFRISKAEKTRFRTDRGAFGAAIRPARRSVFGRGLTPDDAV